MTTAMRGHVVRRQRRELQRHPYVDVHDPMESRMPALVLRPGTPFKNTGTMRHGMYPAAREQRAHERIVGQVALRHGAFAPAGLDLVASRVHRGAMAKQQLRTELRQF